MRKALLINLVLALCWTAMTGRLSVLNLGAGFAIGFVIMVIASPVFGPIGYGARAWHLIELITVFLWDLMVASLRVAVASVRPQHRMRPGVIAIDLDLESDLEIAALANMISLMPGTLTLDISDDRRTLFMHVMHIAGEDVESHQKAVKTRLERRVSRAFRATD